MSLIVPESIDIASLPSLVLAERKQLPNCAACYLVLEGETVVYVGRSANLRLRWRNYHQKLRHLKNRGTKIKIAWLECSEPSLLPAIEKALIGYFQPELNGRKVDGEIAVIQVMMAPEDKAAFDAWCAAHSTTMSEVIRQQIAPFVKKGSELQRNETKPV